MKIKFTHVLIIIALLLGVDLFFNQGRILADIAASANGRPALVIPNLSNQGLTNNMPPRTSNDTVVIDTSAPATVFFVQPEFVVPTAVPQQAPPATVAPVVVIQHSDPAPAPAIVMIQPETETAGGCRGGRSCPRPTAAPTPGVGR